MLAPWNPEMQLSPKYTLRDLTITNQPYPNIPSDAGEIANLKWMAKTLEQLSNDIGPFDIISCYRTAEVQNAVKGDVNGPVPPARLKSFHEAGMGVDMFPTSMEPEEYYRRILAHPNWYGGLNPVEGWVPKLGEIAFKPTQNALHLSLPTLKVKEKVTVMSDESSYVVQTMDQIRDWASPFSEALASAGQYLIDAGADVTTDVDLETGERSMKWWVWVAVPIGLVAAIAGFLYFRKKR